MAEKTETPNKLTLDQAIQVLHLTPDLKFVAKQVFPKTKEVFSEAQWKAKLQKKGIISKTENK